MNETPTHRKAPGYPSFKAQATPAWDILFKAAKEGDLGQLRAALALGANADREDKALGNPLCTALLCGPKYRLIGTEPDQDEERYGKCVEALIQHGVNIDKANPQGFTPVMLAARLNSEGPLRMLIQAGADLVATPPSGTTALMIAASRGHLGCLRQLIDAGAPLDTLNEMSQSALSMCASNGMLASMQMLIDAGAQVDLRDAVGSTPAMHAAYHGQEACVRLLIEAGADMAAQSGPWTVASYAQKTGHFHIVHLIESHLEHKALLADTEPSPLMGHTVRL